MTGSNVAAPPRPPLSRDERSLRAMAAGFGVGSMLFALGTVMLWAQLPLVPVNVTYALGAVCFTTAATVQWRVAVRHNPNRGAIGLQVEWDIRNPDWLSAVTQLIGTLYFNVMTVLAVVQSLGDTSITAKQIWRPDAAGSILFLVSSTIALAPVSRMRRHQLVHSRSWWICALNMIGSIFFGVSAIGQAVLPDGVMVSANWADWGTFLGALGFLGASILLWPGRSATKARAR